MALSRTGTVHISSKTKKLSTRDAYQLARRKQKAGRVAEATAILREMLETDPNHADAHYALGIISYRQNLLDEAESLFRKATTLNRDDGRYWLNLGVVLQRKGDLRSAERYYRKSIAATPENAATHYSLGVVLQMQWRTVEAEQAYRSALKLDPGHKKAQLNLILALCRLNRLDEAESLVNPLLAANPDDPGVLRCYGNLLRARNDYAAAEAPLRRALSQNEDLDTLLALSFVLRHGNRHQEAAQFAQRALELSGSNQSALFEAVMSHHFEPGDPLLETLERQVTSGSLRGGRQVLGWFMLAKACDDLDRFEDAIHWAKLANDAVHGRHPFPVDSLLEVVRLNEAHYRTPTVSGNETAAKPVPIFIVGQSRAGKTLVETLLSSQEGVYAAGESRELEQFLKGHGSYRASASGANQARLSREQSEAFGADFLSLLRARAPGARWVTSTLPAYYMLVGFIFATLPGARVIHCHRDPLDQCVAMYLRMYSNPLMSFTSNPASLAACYRGYARMMAHWRALYGDRILEVPYESLVTHPGETARRIFDYCGIEAVRQDSPVEFNTRGIGRGTSYAPYLADLVKGLAGE